MAHCEVAFLAGQRKAAKGNAGLWLLVFGSVSTAFCCAFAEGEEAVFFFLYLYGEAGGAIGQLQRRYKTAAIWSPLTRRV